MEKEAGIERSGRPSRVRIFWWSLFLFAAFVILHSLYALVFKQEDSVFFILSLIMALILLASSIPNAIYLTQKFLGVKNNAKYTR
jgi:uncharacterized membrane protein YhaH (DUF805 family)